MDDHRDHTTFGRKSVGVQFEVPSPLGDIRVELVKSFTVVGVAFATLCMKMLFFPNLREFESLVVSFGRVSADERLILLS